MKAWQPWFGLASSLGLVLMLVGDGALDVLGFTIAAAPLLYAAVAYHKQRGAERKS